MLRRKDFGNKSETSRLWAWLGYGWRYKFRVPSSKFKGGFGEFEHSSRGLGAALRYWGANRVLVARGEPKMISEFCDSAIDCKL